MMNGTLKQILQGVVDGSSRLALLNALTPAFDRLSTKQLNSAGLTGAGVAVPATGGSACHAMVRGILRSIAAATNMAALSGSVANAAFNVYVYLIDSAGTLTTLMGSPGTTLAAVIFPPIPEGKAVIGFTIINPTGTGPFVGGTTLFNDATVVPNAVHVSVVGALDPQILVG